MPRPGRSERVTWPFFATGKGAAGDVGEHGFHAGVPFLDQEVSDGGHRLQRGDVGDGTVVHVGRHLGSVDFAEGGDLADFGDAAAVDDIRLEDLGAFGIEEVLEVVARYQSFAAGEGDGTLRGDLAEGLGHLAPGGLFDEERVEWRHGFGEFDGRADGEGLPHLESDLEIRTAAFADGFDLGDQPAQALRFGAAFREDPFDTAPAGFARAGREFGQALGRARFQRLAPVAVIDAHGLRLRGSHEAP